MGEPTRLVRRGHDLPYQVNCSVKFISGCPPSEAVHGPEFTFPNVREMHLRQIWYESDGFNRFRGTGWMKEPCRSCPEQEKDLGGCRCQAYLLSGDPTNADPVCDKSPDHRVVTEAVEKAQRPDVERDTIKPLVFRDPKQSRRLSALSP